MLKTLERTIDPTVQFNPMIPVMERVATMERLVRPTKRVWSYQDYLDLPDNGCRYEIIKGELYMSNAPSYDHQFAVTKLVSKMDHFVTENNLGVVLTAPFEIHLAEDTRPVQPDVFFIKAERQPTTGAKFFEGAPDLVVEVISPSSVKTDRHIKFSAYEEARVAEYWLIDPKAQSVEVYTLSAGEYALLGQFVNDEVIQSNVLAGLAIVARSLFISR